MGLFSKRDGEPDVQVHHTRGCDLCGRTDEHTHTQADWRALIDATDPWKDAR